MLTQIFSFVGFFVVVFLVFFTVFTYVVQRTGTIFERKLFSSIDVYSISNKSFFLFSKACVFTSWNFYFTFLFIFIIIFVCIFKMNKLLYCSASKSRSE
jgi:hypothetical protein